MQKSQIDQNVNDEIFKKSSITLGLVPKTQFGEEFVSFKSMNKGDVYKGKLKDSPQIVFSETIEANLVKVANALNNDKNKDKQLKVGDIILRSYNGHSSLFMVYKVDRESNTVEGLMLDVKYKTVFLDELINKIPPNDVFGVYIAPVAKSLAERNTTLGFENKNFDSAVTYIYLMTVELDTLENKILKSNKNQLQGGDLRNSDKPLFFKIRNTNFSEIIHSNETGTIEEAAQFFTKMLFYTAPMGKICEQEFGPLSNCHTLVKNFLQTLYLLNDPALETPTDEQLSELKNKLDNEILPKLFEEAVQLEIKNGSMNLEKLLRYKKVFSSNPNTSLYIKILDKYVDKLEKDEKQQKQNVSNISQVSHAAPKDKNEEKKIDM